MIDASCATERVKMEAGMEMRQDIWKDGLARTVKDTIEAYEMIHTGDTVIAGVSGGADSVCMLDLLRRYRELCPFHLQVIHIEHGIRGQESLEDAAFVENLCSRWGLSCRTERIQVKELARQNGQSVEEAARQARYEVFEACAQQIKDAKIAVAHNQNDQAETVLLNLCRGSGVRGLGGIRPVRGRIIRPLLFAGRGEIEDWIRQQGLSCQVDATNLQQEYTRNRIRLSILPQLEETVNREAIRHLASSAAALQKAEDYLQKQAASWYRDCIYEKEGRTGVLLERFSDAEELMQEYILREAVRRCLKERGLKDYTEGHIRQLKQLAEMDCGRSMDFPGGLRAWREKDILILAAGSARHKNKLETAPEPVFLRENGTYRFLGENFQVSFAECGENRVTDHGFPVDCYKSFPEKKYTKWLAYDTINCNVCLRTRQPGDYLIVNREGGRKKLKEYMIEEKIPREMRDRIVLLAQGSHVLWVVGWRISEGAKLTESTECMIQIQRMEEEHEGTVTGIDIGRRSGSQDCRAGGADQPGL